jgi:hypothetical protein
MDGRTPPADTPATPMGFSVGRWENEVLVIESTHLAVGWLDVSVLPMNGKATLIFERYALAEDRQSVYCTMSFYACFY